MASLLYRLGKFAYQRRWWVISAWLVIIIAVGGSVAAFSGKMTNSFSIPGTASQNVLNTLQEEFPDAAGGVGTIVFATPDGKPFSQDQKDAISDVASKLDEHEDIKEARNPFEIQTQLDSAEEQIAQGETDLQKAKEQLDSGQAQLEQARTQLSQGRAQLETAQKQADQLDAAAAKIEASEQELAEGQTKYENGRSELDDAIFQQKTSQGVRFVSEDQSAAFIQAQFNQEMMSVSLDTKADVQEIALQAEDSGLEVNFSKDIVEDVSGLFGAAEIIGIVVAAAVLMLMLGTFVAAGLPLLMAVVGVGVGVGTAFALTGVIEMSSVSPVLALMLGLAVGIDYCLFIINRHRTQLLRGLPMEESIARATGTSGNAVLFAGLTVIIALAALAVPGIPFLTVLGLVGAGTVAVAVVVALTLTPALLSLMGPKVLSKRAWRRREQFVEAESHETESRGWGTFVTRFRWPALIATILALGVMAIPATQLRLALPDGSSEPVESTAFKSYSQLGESFGEGINGPLIVVGDIPQGLSEQDSREAQLELSEKLRGYDNVEAAVSIGTSEDGLTTAFQVVPTEGPASVSTENLVHELRANAAEIEESTGITIGVTGQPALQIDVSQKLLEALPLYLGIVVGLSLVLLLLVFRSIMVPLIATGGFMLSLGAAFGAIVAIYQWGWLSTIFGVPNPGPILSFLPMILIGVLFGLAMDYQMFLVSGMRESYVHGEDARTAVVSGFNHGAKVVTAAAIIMVSVFAGFIFSHLTMVRPIGFALAFGVLMDAFVVRMTLIPAAMHILGKHAWWLPKWLDRILPDVDVEGAKLLKDTDETKTAEPEPAVK
ncbi:MMPL family transporter [Arthrobacter roseus]|uniref:MMPL family transporter n=1 Tax=Arthrobacter roseus TaxID=136274 RepID=UPI0019666D78|nr:MMPL family transporter [Arthrobacter roseus]MBM7847118.1 RND superfamily putative drug exporter [Arthrobacter roseus]